MKDNQVFFFGRRGGGRVGDTVGIFLFELKYGMGFRNTGFNEWMNEWIFLFIFIFHALRVLVYWRSGIPAWHVLVQAACRFIYSSFDS